MSECSMRLPIDRSLGPKILASFIAGSALLFTPSAHAGPIYDQTNLVTDDQAFLTGLGYAPAVNPADPDLRNPWGIAYSAASPFWVSDNFTGLSTIYNTAGVKQGLVVTLPAGSAPTGQVFNAVATDFLIGGGHGTFMFATEGGTIVARTTGSNVFTAVDHSGSGAVYKGLALGKIGSSQYLYAANFNAGTIEVFDSTFTQVTLLSSFDDPTLPAGYAPFNVQVLKNKLYVSYAVQDGAKHDDVPGAGNGLVNVFNLDGTNIRRVVTNGALNSPWGLDIAPPTFGYFANDLLVGNFGDGTINAYNPITDAFLGTLSDRLGNPIAIDGLWALINGNGGSGGDPNLVYFTAGIGEEQHGLFGSLTSVPEPGSLGLLATALAALGVLRRRKKA